MANSRAVISIYDEPMWKSIRARRMELQQCDDCSRFRYPPAPNCPHCLSMNCRWRPVSGRGKILSWVIFDRQYFDNWKPPYNVVAVALAEGPIVISNLVGPEPAGSWIDRPVELCYETDAAGETISKVRLVPGG
jgi:uncharacterized OB-fold protein